MVFAQSSSAGSEARLDDLGVKALELMQQVISHKMKLQEHIKMGSINLAKSRYIMGNRNVSASQLPTEDSMPFDALCRVEHSSSLVDDVETSIFTLNNVEPKTKKKLGKCDELSDCVNDSQPSCDPLHWFGVLVPQNLRMAQTSFKRAIELSAEIASLQAHLESIRIEFCTLKLEQLKL